MANTLRFGILGCGSIADIHAQAILAANQAELTACCSASAGSASRFAAKYGIQQYKSLEDILNSGRIDAICICTPSGLHTQQAIAALEADKHVVIEKPMSLTLYDADRLIKATKESSKKVAVISQLRSKSSVQAVKKAIDSGLLGRIVSANLSMNYHRSKDYYASAGWRGTWDMDGGGALMNQGIHGIDIFGYLLGRASWLYGKTETLVHSIEVEDTAAAVIGFQNGAIGTINGSTACCPGYARRIEICGDKGSIVLEEDSILRWDVDAPCPSAIGDAKSAAASDPKAISCAGHIRQIENLVDAVLTGEPLLLGPEEGRHALEIILGIYQSSRSNNPVWF